MCRGFFAVSGVTQEVLWTRSTCDADDARVRHDAHMRKGRSANSGPNKK